VADAMLKDLTDDVNALAGEVMRVYGFGMRWHCYRNAVPNQRGFTQTTAGLIQGVHARELKC
jgi:hypothetical protein